VLRRGAATAADDRDVVALDELLERRRQRLGRLREDRLAVRALVGDAGVRDAGHGDGRVRPHEPDRVAHVLGPGRAVEADGVDAERDERRQHRLDVGAEQHLAAVREQRDLGLDRDAAADALEGVTRAEDARLDLEDVLSGLDEEQVDAALEQPLRLLGEDLPQLREADVAERRVIRGGQQAGGADRAAHEALLADRAAGDLGGATVDLERALAEPPLVELEPRRLEGVGLDDLGSRLDHRAVDVLDHVGAVQHERLVALAREAAVVLARQVELLERRAHATVEDDHPALDGGKVIAHGAGNSSVAPRAPDRQAASYDMSSSRLPSGSRK